ncbi:MAG: FixH family protein [Acidimicrobiales bacterium]
MSRSRIGLIALVAVVVFVGAFALFRGDDSGDTQATEAAGVTQTTAAGSVGPCGGSASTDAAYKLAFSSPPRTDAANFEVSITRDGTAVKGAKVCLNTDMVGMSHPPVRGEGTEVSAGTYRFNAKFSMRGSWTGSVTVVPSSGSAVIIPVTFEVT